MSDEIHVKLSGTAVYKAVKNYLNNSPELQEQLKTMVNKQLEPAVLNKIESAVDSLFYEMRHKVNQELDRLVKKEVEARVAEHISRGLKRLFEGDQK